MKICPICQTNYQDTDMLFCIRDGSRLIDAPDSAETEEATVVGARPPESGAGGFTPPNERFTVDVNEPQAENVPPPVASTTPAPNQAPPRKTNVAAIVLLTALGMIVLLGAVGLGGWYLWTRNTREIAGANNQKNGNLAANSNANSQSNSDANLNLDLNANANLASPTPTPKPSPSPTPKPSPTPTPKPSPSPNANNSNNSNDDGNDNANANRNSNVNTGVNTNNNRPTPTPTPRTGPSVISGGVVNGKATRLVTPAYPPAAKAIRASGQVNVQVTIDENGNVISANAVSGHPLLRAAAAQAARQSKFQPTLLSGQPVKVTGVIVYNFNPQ